MGLVPHSGNACSGMCQQPCGHAGCWQCSELVVKQSHSTADQNAARKILGHEPPAAWDEVQERLHTWDEVQAASTLLTMPSAKLYSESSAAMFAEAEQLLEAKARFRQQGATDDDIAAAEKLLRSQPTPAEIVMHDAYWPKPPSEGSIQFKPFKPYRIVTMIDALFEAGYIKP